MTNRWIYAAFSALLGAVACGGGGGKGGDDRTGSPSTGALGEIAETSEAGLTAFVKEGSYQSWAARQPQVVDSVGAHGGKARTYFNAAAAAARSGAASFPKGSVLVKELYDGSGTTLKGQAVMAKADDGQGGGTWLWFEGFAPDYAGPYYGKGVGVCTGCHAQAGAVDFVITRVP